MCGEWQRVGKGGRERQREKARERGRETDSVTHFPTARAIEA